MASLSVNGSTSAGKAGDAKPRVPLRRIRELLFFLRWPTCLDYCEHRLPSSRMTHFAYTAFSDGFCLGPLSELQDA